MEKSSPAAGMSRTTVSYTHLPPITGTYLRLSRFLIAIVTLIITPLFLLMMQNPEVVPDLSLIHI